MTSTYTRMSAVPSMCIRRQLTSVELHVHVWLVLGVQDQAMPVHLLIVTRFGIKPPRGGSSPNQACIAFAPRRNLVQILLA